MKYVLFAFLIFCGAKLHAQSLSEMDAVYLATLKAVVDYKIDDEQTLQQVEKLRDDEKFNQKLRKMLGELDNGKRKNAKNKRVFEILKTTGKKIYNELN